MPARLSAAWKADLGGKLSAVVIAGGKLFVASIDTHTVHALDAGSGKPVWRFTAGGRVDSPPTISNGCAIFGSADGWVYCVRASDGVLVWRYLAARADRKHMAFGQIESVWPVHGSVLVHKGQVYCVAGRSMFLDGGMRLVRINLKTGKLISETILDENIPGTKDNLQTVMKGLNLPVGLPDVLSCDDTGLYMRSQKFTFDGKRTQVASAANPSNQIGADAHLFCATGFLDGSWFHRAYWMYGQEITSGCNYWFRAGRHAPAGRIMVFDDKMIYAYGRKPHLYVWTPALEYRLYAADKKVKPASIERVTAGRRGLDKKDRRWIFNRFTTGSQTVEQLSAADVKWSENDPIMITRAMVLAGPSTKLGTGKILFVAGPPDLLDEEAAIARRWDADVQKQLVDQDAAMLGKKGATLWAVDAASGKRLSELKLEAMPAWDAMAAANGRLYLATIDGKVICLAGKD